MKMTLSHRYLMANLEILDSLGYPKAKALDVLGIEEDLLNIARDRKSLDELVVCINAAAEYTSNPNIALRLGNKFRVGNFGETGSLYSYCKSLGDIVRLNDRYQKLAIDAGSVKLVPGQSGRYKMIFKPYYEDMEKYRPITDLIMAAYMTTYSWLIWGSGERILSTHLSYPRPDDISAHEEIFQSELIFGSLDTFMEFSETTVSEVITTHNPEKLSRVTLKLDKMLGLQMQAHAFEEAIEAAIRGALNSGQISTQIVAERMGMSWSAFRLHLKDSGLGFRPRLDQIRKSIFMEEYRAGRSFGQISMSLGYNDQPAMNRAFKRWFGMTPSKWEKAQFETE